MSDGKGVGTGWGPVQHRGSEDQHLSDSRRLAGHGSKHFLGAYSLIQRQVSLLIGLLLMVSQRKSAAAFNQSTLIQSFLFVCFEVLFCFLFFWLNEFKCYLLYFYSALLK